MLKMIKKAKIFRVRVPLRFFMRSCRVSRFPFSSLNFFYLYSPNASTAVGCVEGAVYNLFICPWPDEAWLHMFSIIS
jgi:hypothetical protein